MNFMSRRLVVAAVSRIADVLLLPFVLAAAPAMRAFRRIGPEKLPLARGLFRRLGYWPLRNHYYDPLIDPREMGASLERPRELLGIDWNAAGQLELLGRMRFAAELAELVRCGGSNGAPRFTLVNGSFESGDADFLYGLVRLTKPRHVLEVGCGNSTLLIHAANARNRADDPSHDCAHVCVEPFEQPWLDTLDVKVVRERVESLPPRYFEDLRAGDLLFIDSSHMIRPGGDVLFEILHLLPRLASGVIVHFHDIFTPRDYLREWIVERGVMWNEQYLLEAFLANNAWYRIVGSLNWLHHNHYEQLAAICVEHLPGREPGSFYIQRA